MSYKNRWSDSERVLFENLMGDALALDASTSVRANYFAERVDAAAASGQQWAVELAADAQARGFKNLYRAEARKGTVTVMLDGREVEKPSLVSVKKQNSEGVVFEQLAFFDTLTRQQVADKRLEYLKQRRAYDSNIAVMDKLAALMDAAGADDVETACAFIGVSVEDWLGAELTAERVAS